MTDDPHDWLRGAKWTPDQVAQIRRRQRRVHSLLRTTKPKGKINMDNQHRKIKGYRELSQEEIDAMNDVKKSGRVLGEYIEALGKDPSLEVDQRWLAIAKTDLQKGFMALTRSIAKPDFF